MPPSASSLQFHSPPSALPHHVRLLPWMSAFFIAMAFLESAVVVYLRALYYPEGFDFPLAPMSPTLVGTEIGREAATILMLLAVPAVVTRRALERFAWFCFGFGVWDIFYYVWLKVLLDWPSSLFSRDLLFLIPVPWVGPVWAPCVISLGLITTALVILHGRDRDPAFRVSTTAWALLIVGALLMILSFVIDPLQRSFGVQALLNSSGDALINGREYMPEHYPWPWFAAGFVFAVLGLFITWRSALRPPIRHTT
ncbi:MAG: hypothetical protein IPO05_13670 [Flavobacteriales bacterium]|nr:hypothetical protein [Flavobacteriales bacterium]